ncbi:MAG: hypothetical protein HQL39_20550 [Alphaproteobacteria bacterium]|nr:hypothetical protein [Alphaproteobacteria bacterium]
MGAAVSEALQISLTPERLDEGSAEERAAFGLLCIQANGAALTEGFDHFIMNYRRGPLVSGYHAAEWLAWNWWRLRWEPRSRSPDWWRAHKMTAIGEGYVWPNLTIFSDGLRTALLAAPSSRPDAKPFRYTGANPRVVPSTVFEQAVDSFVPQILARLRDAGIEESNLHTLWNNVLDERRDPTVALRRKFEALLGVEPDEADTVVDQLIRDAQALGQDAMGEVAADTDLGRTVSTASDFRAIAEREGYDSRSGDMVRLEGDRPHQSGPETPAWLAGTRAAKALRQQEGLGDGSIENDRLARMVGVQTSALGRDGRTADMSFILDEGPRHPSRIVLRSKWDTGRRFELARLLGDRLMTAAGQGLFPATRSHTFRQKAQRAFAAEFLAPFDEVNARLDGDFSEESRQDVAGQFGVSELAIRTLLVNHRRLERDELDEDFDVAAA